MKTQEQIERKIKKLENRIDQLEVRYEKTKSESIFRQIEWCEEQIELLNWVLGNEEY